MNRYISLILYVLGITGLLVESAHAIVPYEPVSPVVTCGEDVELPRDELSPAEELSMWNEIRRNIATLREQALLPAPDITQVLAYTFPLRLAPGLSDYAGFRVSAFVDHNSTAGQVQDYNGGARTYDGHRGTDYALWPFSWNKVNAGEVQVIAAAAGTIVNKANTDSTDHNPCDGGSNNDQWNYVALEHADGRLTIYGHMRYNSLTTKAIGETVAQGEYLGTAASSGNSSGPHLHFEMRFGTYSNAEWIDPYAGPASQPESLWASQRPYRDSAINKLSTHSAQPIDTPCQPTATNLQNSFTTPVRILFYSYYRDYQGTLPTQGKIYRPDGTLFHSWSYTDGTTFSSGTNRSWAFDFSDSDPAGRWRFEATYNGQTYETFFTVDSPTVLPIKSGASLPAILFLLRN